jgi:signal transduction histidine kinase
MAVRRASPAEQLARLCATAQAELATAGRALHDEIGPLLAGAGMWLSTAPSGAAVESALAALDQAMERVRALSQRLNPSPAARLGLPRALLRLAENDERIQLRAPASTKLPREAATVLYEAAVAAIEAARQARARRIRVQVSPGGTSVRVADDGRSAGRSRALAVALALAAAQGARTSLRKGKSTIVSIRYAARRSAGG